MSATPSLSDLTQEILNFRDERDWGQFHTLRQLAAAVAIEVAELQELFLWKTDEEAALLAGSEPGATRVRHEMADILIYALLIAAALGVDPAVMVREKLQHNAAKYPVSTSKGSAAKYGKLFSVKPPAEG